MKRDWECIRAILIALDEKGDTASALRPIEVDGFDRDSVSYNMRLLIDAALIKGDCIQPMDSSVRCTASEMTWEGHELLDKMRSDTLWNKIKSAARERAIPLSFDVVKILGIEAIKSLN
jgi:hypothetical protein